MGSNMMGKTNKYTWNRRGANKISGSLILTLIIGAIVHIIESGCSEFIDINVKNDGEILVGKSVMNEDIRNICENSVSSSEDYFRWFSKKELKICAVPKEGLHGKREASGDNAINGNIIPFKKGFGQLYSNLNEVKSVKNGWKIGKLYRKLNDIEEFEGIEIDRLGRSVQSELGSNGRSKRRSTNLDHLFFSDKGKIWRHENELYDSNRYKTRNSFKYANETFVNHNLKINETNNLLLFNQGLEKYRRQLVDRYYLYDKTEGKHTQKIVYPKGVLSTNTPYNYLAKETKSYVISEVSEPKVLGWPVNHVVFVNAVVNDDGTLRIEIKTSSGSTGFYFSVSNRKYETGCSGYSRKDDTNFFHLPGFLVQLQLVRKMFGFIVFVDGARRPKLDIIDCYASVPVSISVSSGKEAMIFPAVEDCKVSQWTDWSSCSKTCSAGSKVRFRSVIMPRMNGGVPCPVLLDTTSCNVDIECTPCNYSMWTSWSECSSSCGTGTSTRTRYLISSLISSDICVDTVEIRTCRETFCAEDCILTEWSVWSECTTTCNTGTQFSSRSVVKSETNGGKCEFEFTRTQECNTAACLLPCDPNPCLNGGSCTELPMSNYMCVCNPFYGGQLCENSILPWWIYYFFVVLGFLVVGLFYKFFLSDALAPNSLTPIYDNNSGDGTIPQLSALEPPQYAAGQQNPYYSENYFYGGFGDNMDYADNAAGPGFYAQNGGNWNY